MGAQGGEEVVVVVRHAGIVEERGRHGVTGELQGDVLREIVLIWLARGEFVELLHQETLIVGPCDTEAMLADKPGDACRCECCVELEWRYSVISSLLLLLPSVRGYEGGSGLEMDQLRSDVARESRRTHDGHTHVDGEEAVRGLARRLVIISAGCLLTVHPATSALDCSKVPVVPEGEVAAFCRRSA